jgi:hypothetical protein
MWLRAFVVTAFIEIPIVVVLTRGTAFPAWRRAMVALLGQIATHPAVWFIFPRIAGLTGLQATVLSESWAFLAEACLYAVALPGVRPLRALGISAIANGTSYGLGLALCAWRKTF